MNDNGPTEEPGAEVSQATVIGQICDGFESAWQAGERPRLEEYLSRLPEAVSADARRELLSELVMIDLECRWRTTQLASLSADETAQDHSLDTLSDRPLVGVATRAQVAAATGARRPRARTQLGEANSPNAGASSSRSHRGDHTAAVFGLAAS